MAETRESIPVSLTIQLPNPVQPPQWGGALLLSRLSVITSGGQVVYQQAGHITEPAIATDLTPELVEHANAQLARLGYQLVPVGEGA